MTDLLNPEEFKAENKDGVEKTYILHDIPAMESREIATLYVPNFLPKVGDYSVNKSMLLKMMSYVSAVTSSGTIRLSTEALVNNHADFVQLTKLERAMIEKNFGFFLQGTISNFSETLKRIAPQLISAISTGFLAQSSQKNEQPSTN